MKRFLSELRRRNVLRVAAFYATAGWLLVQIATQVLPVFEMPPWTMRVVVVAVVLLLANQFVPHRNRNDALAKAIAVLPLVNDIGNPSDEESATTRTTTLDSGYSASPWRERRMPFEKLAERSSWSRKAKTHFTALLPPPIWRWFMLSLANRTGRSP